MSFLICFTDLLGIPLVCEVEFSIKLESSTRPICTIPYCMASAKLKKLNSQLQDLLGKGFIRSSVYVYEKKSWLYEYVY